MKTECGIIQDLLPLYEDGVCSPESRAAVEEHLRECDTCRERHQRMTAPLPEQAEGEREQAAAKEGRRFRKGLRKVRRRWAVSLIAALLVVPLAFMSAALVTGDGVCFTNLGHIAKGYHFLSLLKQGEYGKAFDMLSLESAWQDLTDYEGVVVGKNYRAVTIDGQTWMLSPDAQEEFFSVVPDTLEGEEALDFWEETFLHTQIDSSYALIPAAAWEALLSERGLSEMLADMGLPFGAAEIQDSSDMGSMIENGYLRGAVHVSDAEGNSYYIASFHGYLAEETDPSTFLYQMGEVFPCVPEAVWETMAEEAEKRNAAFTERALQYLAMGYEEWLARSREQFIAGMEEWEAEHGRVTGIRFHAAYGRGTGTFRGFSDTWQLNFDLSFAGSENGEGGITLVAEGGKLRQSGSYRDVNSGVVGEFLDTFSRIKYYRIPDSAE